MNEQQLMQVAGTVNQLVKGPNKEEVIVNGPMVAGRTSENAPMTGSTYSHIGAEVEEFLTFFIDGRGATAGTETRKVIFDALQTTACRMSCSGAGAGAGVDANLRVYGENVTGCDSLVSITNILKTGLCYDILGGRVEDITGNGSADLNYTIMVHRYNANGAGGSKPLRLEGKTSPYQQNQAMVDFNIVGFNSRLDPQTGWEVPVKAGKVLKVTLYLGKRYQWV
jgi:hypothetical protein